MFDGARGSTDTDIMVELAVMSRSTRSKVLNRSRLRYSAPVLLRAAAPDGDVQHIGVVGRGLQVTGVGDLGELAEVHRNPLGAAFGANEGALPGGDEHHVGQGGGALYAVQVQRVLAGRKAPGDFLPGVAAIPNCGLRPRLRGRAYISSGKLGSAVRAMTRVGEGHGYFVGSHVGRVQAASMTRRR